MKPRLFIANASRLLAACILAATSLRAGTDNTPLGINRTTKELSETAVKVGSGQTFTIKSGGTIIALTGSTVDFTAATVTIPSTLTFSATQITSGTLPDGRFPATLPAASGVNLTALNATNLGSGTVPDARFPATLPALSGVNLTALNATNLGSGTVPDARFPATLPALSGVNLTALNASNLSSGTVADARLSLTNTIAIFHKDGTTTYYRPSANTDVARGTALVTAAAAAVAYDTVRLGGGTFDLGTGKVVLADNVSLIGAGPRVTEIKAQTIATTGGVIVQPGNSSYVADLTITCNAAVGNPQLPIGVYKSTGSGIAQSAATNVVLMHIETSGESDGLFLGHEDSPAMAWRCYGCVFSSQYDGVAVQSSGVTLELHDCKMIAAGPATYGGGATSRGVQISGASGGSIVRLWNCDVSASGSTTNYAITHGDSTAALVFELFGCRLSGTTYDLHTAGIGSTVRARVAGCYYDRTKVSSTTRIKDVTALGDLDGLSAPGTARTNLGMTADAQSLVTAADYAAMKTLLGLATASSPTFTGLTLSGALQFTGTGGASYICLPYQSAAPSTPAASKLGLYADTLGKPTFINPAGITSGLLRENHRYSVDLYSDFLSNSGIDGFTTTVSGTSATGNLMATAVTGHPGLRALSTGTTTTGRAATEGDSGFAGVLLGGAPGYFETNTGVPTVSDGTETFTYRVGLINSVSAEPTDGVYFRYTHSVVSGHWQGVCRASGTETATDLTDAVVAGQYDTLRIEWNSAATSVTFYVNGVSRATTATNIPTTVSNSPGAAIIKSAGTTSRSVNVDYIHFHMDFATAR